MAVQRSLGWASVQRSETMTGKIEHINYIYLKFFIWCKLIIYFFFFVLDERYQVLASIPASWFVMTSFVLLRLSYYLENR